MSFNANATEWKPSAAAASWNPSNASTPAPEPAPTPKQEESTTCHDEIEESDPLWQAVLKITHGDNDRASKMIGDPDSLMQYPEIVALLGSSNDEVMEDGGEEDWEKEDQEIEDTDKMDVDKSLSQQLGKTAIGDKKEVPEAITTTKPVPKKATVDIEEKLKEVDPREHINLVFIGHVDAGKSTLSGNILYLTDNVDKRTIERYEREAKERNRESWFLAFIMDTNEEERAKGKTVEVGRAEFETEKKRYTILDAPGHKNYVPNMIMGASQADIAVLVISARKGEFETGFDRGGQTREHAMLAKTLGVSYLVVVINKMDDPTVQWQKSRYDECVGKLRPFLKSCGFVIKKEVKFIPISGLTGANVIKRVDNAACPWWEKCVATAENNTRYPTLVEMLDQLEIKGRDTSAALRIPVLDRYTDRGTIAMGKVESGAILPGMKVTIMPTRRQFKVDQVWANEEPVSLARPGENVLIKLSNCGTEDILKGFVICSDPPCRSVDKLICQIGIMDMPDNCKILTNGFQAMFHAHTCEEECTIVKLFETTSSLGQVNKNPRFANIGMKLICMIQLAQTVPVETFDEYPFLGRFTLRTEGKTIAIGKINKLPPKKVE